MLNCPDVVVTQSAARQMARSHVHVTLDTLAMALTVMTLTNATTIQMTAMTSSAIVLTSKAVSNVLVKMDTLELEKLETAQTLTNAASIHAGRIKSVLTLLLDILAHVRKDIQNSKSSAWM